MAKGLKSVPTLSAKEIAEKHGLPLAYIAKQIAAGVKVEKEHTKSTKEANEIARDHLSERPDYYIKLHKMEKSKVVKEGISAGPERASDYTLGDAGGGSTLGRKLDVKEGARLDKAKKAAMAGITAANLYTAGDVMSRASEGRGGTKGDVVRMATTLPGAAGWAATGVHYAKKAYDKVKQMKEEKNMPNPCWKGYKAYGMKKKGGKEVPNCVPIKETGQVMSRYTERPTYENRTTKGDVMPQVGGVARGIYEDDVKEGYASIGHSYDWAGDVNPRAKFYGKKPKPTTTKNDEKDDTYKDSKQGGKVKFAKTVKEGLARDKRSVKRDEPITIMKRNDPLEQRKGKESTRQQYEREFPADYARRKIAKGNLTPKDEIKASLGKHHKPGHLPEEQIDEMDTSGMRPSTNIDDRRGLGASILGAYRASKYNADKMGLKGGQAQGAAAIDTAKSLASTAVKNMSNFIRSGGSDTGAGSLDKPTPKAKLPNDATDDIMIPPAGKLPGSGNLNNDKPMITGISPAPKPTSGGISPSPGGISPAPKKQVNEISAELVGKVSNARWRRGETPSKTLTRAINKKFIEAGKKLPEQPPFEGSHKRSHEKSSTHVKRLAMKAMKAQMKEDVATATADMAPTSSGLRPTTRLGRNAPTEISSRGTSQGLNRSGNTFRSSSSVTPQGRIAARSATATTGARMAPTASPMKPTSVSGPQVSAPKTSGVSGRGSFGTGGGSMKPTSVSGSTSLSQGGTNVGGKMAASKQTSSVVKGMTTAGREAASAVTKAAPTIAKGLGTVARVAAGPAATAAAAVMSPTPAGEKTSEFQRQSDVAKGISYKAQGRSVADYEKQVLTPSKDKVNTTPGQGSTSNIEPVKGGSISNKADVPTPPSRPDYFSRGQAFSAARKEAGGGEGKFSYDSKSFQTNVSGEPYKPSSQLKQTSIKEGTMDTKDQIQEAIGNIMEENLVEMKENFLAVLQEKAMEKLEERKKDIASNYFAQ